jgi:hypothetical protein
MTQFPLKIHCNRCKLEVDLTHFEVWESVRLSMQDIAKKTPISEFKTKPLTFLLVTSGVGKITSAVEEGTLALQM